MTSRHLFSAVLLCATLSAGRADELPLIHTTIRSIEVFKNGVGFVNRSGDANLTDGWAKLESLPASTLGSLWIGATNKDSSVVEMVNYKDKEFRTSEAREFQELLTLNIGKRVALIGGDGKRTEGVLVSAPSDAPMDPAPLVSNYRVGMDARMPESHPGDLVLIRTSSNGKEVLLSLHKSSIQSMELLDAPVLNSKTESDVERTKIRVEGAAGKIGLAMNYLQKGWTWSPFYKVNIADEKMASITLDAILMNDMDDLENVDVSFVVGSPNFLYMNVANAFGLRQSVADFLQAFVAGNSQGAQIFANVMNQSAMYNSIASDQNSFQAPTSMSLPGEGSQDYYFYTKKGVTLKKGERGRYSVFSSAVPYEHLYDWTIADSSSVDDRNFRQNFPIKKEPENKVWHMIRLQNTTKQPFTTAPALTMNGAAPVAQDLLGYAPPGQKSLLKLTVAPDVKAEHSQVESARKPVNADGRLYEEITLDGKLRVTNLKSSEIQIVIHKSIDGAVIESGDGNVTKLSNRLSAYNTTSEIVWELSVEPGKSVERTYEYKVLVGR